MWLGGFNDDFGGTFAYDCQWVECPYTYMPYPYDGDFDRDAEELGPFGTDKMSSVKKGMCPTNTDYFSDDEYEVIG